jgi:hypothetical protein
MMKRCSATLVPQTTCARSMIRRSSSAAATSREGHLPRSVRRMLKRRPSLLLATYEVLGFRGIKPGASLRLNPAQAQARELSPDPGSKFMGTTANLTVFALLRGQPMLRRPYLGIGEATKRQAVAAWNALPSKRRHFVAIDGQSRQRTEQNHGVKQSSPPRRLGGRPGMRSSRCPLVACLDVMGSSVPPAPMDLFGSSALCWASEFARFPKLRGVRKLKSSKGRQAFEETLGVFEKHRKLIIDPLKDTQRR